MDQLGQRGDIQCDGALNLLGCQVGKFFFYHHAGVINQHVDLQGLVGNRPAEGGDSRGGGKVTGKNYDLCRSW